MATTVNAPLLFHRLVCLSPRPVVRPPSCLPALSKTFSIQPLESESSLRSLCRRRQHVVSFAVPKLADAELISVTAADEGFVLKDTIPPAKAGVYGVHDSAGELQFVGISRNVAASVENHLKSVPQLCAAVKIGFVDEAAPDRTVLTNAWKSWLEEHIAATGKPPPGNVAGNNTWVGRTKKPADLRLTPGRHVQLTVPLEELIDRLVKENNVVAFIKGSRSAPQCGFSQRVLTILESHQIEFVTVDILDEEHNPGLRETLKSYSNWPTFPQVFVGGDFVGGCDILSSMAEKGELAALFQK